MSDDTRPMNASEMLFIEASLDAFSKMMETDRPIRFDYLQEFLEELIEDDPDSELPVIGLGLALGEHLVAKDGFTWVTILDGDSEVMAVERPSDGHCYATVGMINNILVDGQGDIAALYEKIRGDDGTQEWRGDAKSEPRDDLRPLTAREAAHVEEALDFLASRFQARRPLPLDRLQMAYDVYLDAGIDDDDAIEALGLAFGELLVRFEGHEWSHLTDEDGTEIVAAVPGKVMYASPITMMRRRLEAREKATLSSLYDQVVRLHRQALDEGRVDDRATDGSAGPPAAPVGEPDDEAQTAPSDKAEKEATTLDESDYETIETCLGGLARKLETERPVGLEYLQIIGETALARNLDIEASALVLGLGIGELMVAQEGFEWVKTAINGEDEIGVRCPATGREMGLVHAMEASLGDGKADLAHSYAAWVAHLRSEKPAISPDGWRADISAMRVPGIEGKERRYVSGDIEVRERAGDRGPDRKLVPLTAEEADTVEKALDYAARLQGEPRPLTAEQVRFFFNFCIHHEESDPNIHASLAMSFGALFVHHDGFEWMNLVDEFGEEIVVAVPGKCAWCCPYSMMMKRLAKGERILLEPLYRDTLRQIRELLETREIADR